MSDFLQQMAESSRERVREAQRRVSQAKLLEQAQATPAPPRLQLRDGFDLIAELKIRSPAAGALSTAQENVPARITTYAKAGAAAVSVLTEPSRFDGSMEHLQTAVSALVPFRVPAMRKDFLVDPYQVLEARAAGAGGVLVILRMLSLSEIGELLDCARQNGLFVLIEAFDEQDIELAHRLVDERHENETLLVGVNCRDLTTLKVVPGRLEQLVDRLPTKVPRVAESGLESPADAGRLAAAGYDLALVGSALMKGADPAAMVSEMLAAGRAARASRKQG